LGVFRYRIFHVHQHGQDGLEAFLRAHEITHRFVASS
jgi:hypothetical protein